MKEHRQYGSMQGSLAGGLMAAPGKRSLVEVAQQGAQSSSAAQATPATAKPGQKGQGWHSRHSAGMGVEAGRGASPGLMAFPHSSFGPSASDRAFGTPPLIKDDGTQAVGDRMGLKKRGVSDEAIRAFEDKAARVSTPRQIADLEREVTP